MRLVFLGTGGGGHMMFSQVRATGGLFFDLGDVRFIVDPGPGALVHARSLGLDPEKWNGLFISHLHPDNCSDANVLLDGMKDAFLVAEQHCILPMEKLKQRSKEFKWYPAVSYYHQTMVKSLNPVKHKDRAKVTNLSVNVYRSLHYDPTVGYKITHQKITIGYPADGPYYKGQEDYYDGCDILILNVLAPKGAEQKEKKHMSIDDAITLVKGMKNRPKLIILQHFSFWMIRSNLWKQSKILQDATKVKVVHAEDFMEIDLQTFETKILKKKQV